ncbi:uncharacterized protein LOC130899730 isoform X1 [Diorhabda carinulata]|uniref:uncharacterized protein LOC130899730 isoform X1 n=1 Tax=Diorhabda carinulata TaxID=1163345 RepID=UPI0025A00BA0|nr:uncharacterized protein LOC130899730 isoform X1 [Diorhabda carinulata]
MAKAQINSNQSKVIAAKTTTTTTVTDKCSLCLVITTGVTLILVVIIGICVKFLLDNYVSNITLICLICFEIVLGIIVLSILAWRRKKSKTNQTVVAVRRNGQYQSLQPTAPVDSSWDYTNRETMPV